MARASIVGIRTSAVLAFALAVYLAVTRPIGAGEADLWYQLVRPPLREAWHAPNAWSGLLYSIVAERFIGIFRLSELSLRSPALLSAAVAAGLIWKTRSLMYLVVYGVGVVAGWYSTAASYGLALALWCFALECPRQAGWLFGLAIAACPPFAVLGVTWWRINDVERVLIPAVVLAFILLILPASHAGPSPVPDPRPEFQRELNRRNAARGGAFQPPAGSMKCFNLKCLPSGHPVAYTRTEFQGRRSWEAIAGSGCGRWQASFSPAQWLRFARRIRTISSAAWPASA